jgi:high-affinity Fe2+/Pb2+ permease
MTSELAKTISTCAIWGAMATILTFGLFRMNGSTEFFVITTFILACAAAVATAVVWLSPRHDAAKPGAESRPNEREANAASRSAAEDHAITSKPRA